MVLGVKRGYLQQLRPFKTCPFGHIAGIINGLFLYYLAPPVISALSILIQSIELASVRCWLLRHISTMSAKLRQIRWLSLVSECYNPLLALKITEGRGV